MVEVWRNIAKPLLHHLLFIFSSALYIYLHLVGTLLIILALVSNTCIHVGQIVVEKPAIHCNIYSLFYVTLFVLIASNNIHQNLSNIIVAEIIHVFQKKRYIFHFSIIFIWK